MIHWPGLTHAGSLGYQLRLSTRLQRSLQPCILTCGSSSRADASCCGSIGDDWVMTLTLKGNLNPSCWLLGVLVVFLPFSYHGITGSWQRFPQDFAPSDPDDPQLGIFGGLEHHCWLDGHRCALQLCACPGWENIWKKNWENGRKTATIERWFWTNLEIWFRTARVTCTGMITPYKS